MYWIQDENGMAGEIIDFDPAGKFHPNVVWVPLNPRYDALVNPDYVIVDDEVQPPSLEYLDTQLFPILANLRWTATEEGFIDLNGVRITTDEITQSRVANAVQLAQIFERNNGEGSFKTIWKAANADVELTLTQLEAAGVLVGQKVQEGFQIESEIRAAIVVATTFDDKFNVLFDMVRDFWDVPVPLYDGRVTES